MYVEGENCHKNTKLLTHLDEHYKKEEEEYVTELLKIGEREDALLSKEMAESTLCNGIKVFWDYVVIA